MRIRTIKPEFWSHPVMARLDDDTQLLALALLSMADDEGYFHADPSIVRGTVMPFREDLARISRCLATLSEVGWIDLASHPEHGQLGKIRAWDKHQKVDHSKASKIKTYWAREPLATTSRQPPENLAPDQGTGNREQGKEAAALPNQLEVKPDPPEAPSYAELESYASMHSIPKPVLKSFVVWHNKNHRWLVNGKLIPWQIKMMQWAVQDRENSTVSVSVPDNRPVSVRQGFAP